jgi:high affinity Mn2+ porin
MRPLALALVLALSLPCLRATADSVGETSEPKPPFTDKGWFLFGGQFTGILQSHAGVPGPYFNPALSFGPDITPGWTTVVTAGIGFRLWSGAAISITPEYANGRGMPNASGVAGYPNGDIVRVPSLGSSPYFARVFFRQEIALSADRDPEPADLEARLLPSGILAGQPGRAKWRLEITLGKFAMNDLFDVSDVAKETRHGFMNWALWQMGAWDYAADTRGYTFALVVGLESPQFAVRAGVALMPTYANGRDFDWHLEDHREEILEAEIRYRVLGQRGRADALFYMNHAHMGNYARAVALAPPGTPPSIIATRQTGAVKVGGGLLLEQSFGSWLSGFFRFSMNSGQTETFAFTEIDREVAFGLVATGGPWKREADRVGFALAVNGLSDEHARYLAAGGVGFQLGDGALSYSMEKILEFYYLFEIHRYLEVSVDIQGIFNPGYNAARGPAAVFGLRVHTHL